MFRTVLLVLVWSAISADAQVSANDHADKAADFVQRGDLRSAENELREAVKLAPSDPAFLTSLGGVLGMEGQLEQANLYLTRAVHFRPDDALLRRNLAANEWQLGKVQAAERDLELLLKENPKDENAKFLLGMVSENTKNYSRSVALLASIPESDQRRPEAFVALASSYYHLNQREKARASLKKLLDSSPSGTLLTTGGKVALDHHDYVIALRILTEAANRLPDSYEVFLMKSQTERMLNYYAQAEVSARRAVALHSSLETRRQLAAAEWQAGDKKESTADFESLEREFPSDPGIYETYGTFLLDGALPEDRSRAIAMLKKAISLNASSVEACYRIGNIELSEGHPERALTYLERANRVDPDDSRVHFALSRVYRHLGREADAERELQRYQDLKQTPN